MGVQGLGFAGLGFWECKEVLGIEVWFEFSKGVGSGFWV